MEKLNMCFWAIPFEIPVGAIKYAGEGGPGKTVGGGRGSQEKYLGVSRKKICGGVVRKNI